MPRVRGGRLRVERGKLSPSRLSPQTEPVVEEAEGPLAVHGDQPEGELGHLDRERVDVDAVEAVVGHQAAGSSSTGSTSVSEAGAALASVSECQVASGPALGVPGFDEAVGQVAAGRHEEGA